MHVVDVSIKSRVVTIKGPRGSITKNLSHLNVELRIVDVVENEKKKRAIRVRMWFGQYKQKCQVKTVHTLLSNMIQGVREVSDLFSFRGICLTSPCGDSVMCRARFFSLQRVN